MVTDSAVTTLTKLFVVALIGITVVSTAIVSRRAGPRAAIPSLIGLYLSIILAVGVFAGGLLDPRFQVAFAFGLVAIALYVYLSISALLGALLAIVGLFTLGTKGRELLGR